jgi:hypothetical protein
MNLCGLDLANYKQAKELQQALNRHKKSDHTGNSTSVVATASGW